MQLSELFIVNNLFSECSPSLLFVNLLWDFDLTNLFIIQNCWINTVHKCNSACWLLMNCLVFNNALFLFVMSEWLYNSHGIISVAWLDSFINRDRNLKVWRKIYFCRTSCTDIQDILSKTCVFFDPWKLWGKNPVWHTLGQHALLKGGVRWPGAELHCWPASA